MKQALRTYLFLSAALVLLSLPAKAQQQALSLHDAVNLASQHNALIKAASLESEKARQQKKISRSLYLPSVSLTAQSFHFFDRTPFFGFGADASSSRIPYGRFGGEDQFSAGVTAVQPIFRPEAFPSVRLSTLQERESALKLEQVRDETLAAVKLAYLQVLVLQERIHVQEETIRRNQRALQDARVLFAQGKGLRVDTLRAYTALKNREPELRKLHYTLETRKQHLQTLIGVDTLVDLVLTDSLVVSNTEDVPAEEEVYLIVKNNNPQFQLLRLREQLNDQQTGIQRAARLPVISLIGQYQLQSQSNNFEYGNAYYPSSSFIGLQLAVPLFNGFSTRAKIRDAELSHKQVALERNYAEEELRAIVHEELSRLHESRERLQTTAAVKETAQVSYDITQYRYKRGIASRLEVTDAELELSTAQSNYLEAVYDYLSAQIALEKRMNRY